MNPRNISKAASLRPALPVQGVEPIAIADLRTKQASASQAIGPQTPANQEHAPVKPSESISSTVSFSAPSASTVVAHIQATVGEQASAAASPLNLLTPVASTASSDSAIRSLPEVSTAPTPPPQNSPQTAAAGPIEMARLLAGAAQSEMHIGLHTQAFGSVEVHTTVRDSQVGLTVGSERGDLRSLLATEISGLQTTFRQQELHFDQIRYLPSSTGSGTGFSGGGNSQPHWQNRGHSPPTAIFSFDTSQEISPALDLGSRVRARLSVHA